MDQPKKTTTTLVIDYFKKLEIEISNEDAALVLEHLTDNANQALNEYFESLGNQQHKKLYNLQ
jgi:DNA-binding protein Fis